MISTHTGPAWTPRELIEVASCQKYIIRLIQIQMINIALFIASIVGKMPGPMQTVTDVVAMLSFAGWIIVGCLCLVGVYRMAKSLRVAEAMVYVLLAVLVPAGGLIILFVMNSQATGLLRRCGVDVGVMGANPADIERLKSEVGVAA